jgi:hypothetical protein
MGLPRLAFYGRTNAGGVNAVHILAGQLDACLQAAEDRATVAYFFYELADPLDELTVLAVRGAGGPPCRDGGWEDLAAALKAPGRGFEAIVCATPGRLSTSLREVEARAALAARHGVPVTSAEDLPTLFPHLAVPARQGEHRPTTVGDGGRFPAGDAPDVRVASLADAPAGGHTGDLAEAVLRVAANIHTRPWAPTIVAAPRVP